jgi:ribosomal protein L35
LLSHESSKRKRALRGTKIVHKSNEKQISLLLPYA